MGTNRTRYMRDYQARRRGSTSYKSLLEDAAVIVAWANGDISEGVASKALGIDRVEARGRLLELVALGLSRVNEGK